MPDGIKRAETSASNSFTLGETRLFNQLMAVVRRGGDPMILLRRKEYRSLAAKFLRMEMKMVNRHGGGKEER